MSEKLQIFDIKVNHSRDSLCFLKLLKYRYYIHSVLRKMRTETLLTLGLLGIFSLSKGQFPIKPNFPSISVPNVPKINVPSIRPIYNNSWRNRFRDKWQQTGK